VGSAPGGGSGRGAVSVAVCESRERALPFPSSVSIVIPAFHEAQKLPRTLGAFCEAMDELGLDCELIVVDDGSLDGTYDVANSVAMESRRIKVMGCSPNRGKGHAVLRGFRLSSGEIVGFVDADLEVGPEQFAYYFEKLKMADVVVASKRHPGSRIVYPFHRRFLSRAFNLLVRMLFGLRVSDTQCGFKFFRWEVLSDVVPRLRIKRFAFDVELLVLAKRSGYRIVEGPISFRHGEDRIKFKDIFRMALDLLSIFYRLHFTKIYDRVIA